MAINKYIILISKCNKYNFIKPLKLYLSEDVVYNFINRMTEESKCCREVIKNDFNKKLKIIKEDDKNFESSSKSWICGNAYIDGNINPIKDGERNSP